jgi:hypothetical protein
MDDATTQSEILRLRQEITRLQAQLEAQQAFPELANLSKDQGFITDLARFAESICTEADVRKKWRLSNEDWERLGSDDALVRTIEDEKIRRIRNGTHAREKAQQVFVETPTVLGDILRDNDASPRHRIEAAREIRAVAATGPEAQSPAERFVITINLGADQVLRFDKSVTPVANDKDVEVIDSTAFPMIAAKNREGNDDNGEPL